MAACDSAARPPVRTEDMPGRADRRPLRFLDGVGTGLCAVAVLPLVALLLQGGAVRDLYRDFEDVYLPWWSRAVLHPAWRIGLPLVAAALATTVLVRRPRWRYAMIAVAGLVWFAVVATYLGSTRPLYQLADQLDGG